MPASPKLIYNIYLLQTSWIELCFVNDLDSHLYTERMRGEMGEEAVILVQQRVNCNHRNVSDVPLTHTVH